MERELRSIESINAEIRATRRGRIIEGYAIVFNKESRDLGGFTEMINPSSLDGIIENSDVLALLNHDENRGVLARSTNGEGSLKLSVDNFGLKYTFEAPDTILGDEVLSGVRRGDIRTSSFSFSVKTDGQKWEKRGESYLRTINKFDSIYDVSPVYREAYIDTTVAVRKLIEIRTANALSTALDSANIITDPANEPSDKPPSSAADVEPNPPLYTNEELANYYSKLRNLIPQK